MRSKLCVDDEQMVCVCCGVGCVSKAEPPWESIPGTVKVSVTMAVYTTSTDWTNLLIFHELLVKNSFVKIFVDVDWYFEL